MRRYLVLLFATALLSSCSSVSPVEARRQMFLISESYFLGCMSQKVDVPAARLLCHSEVESFKQSLK